MSRSLTTFLLACVLLVWSGTAQAQSATATGNVAVTVGAEASIQVADVSLIEPGTNFGAYAGDTTFTYKIRTGATGASIVLKVTTDFTGSGGPYVGTPPTAGDTLTYTCAVSSPANACSPQTASTSGTTPVSTFSANAHSAIAGNTGTVHWTLVNDPVYAVGTYTAVVTYTISAT